MRSRRKYPLGDFGLLIVLFLLFAFSLLGQAFAQFQVAMEEAKSHQEPFEMVAFWWQFAASTFENWQSEFLQLFTFVLVSTYLIFRGSPQSRDGDDEMKADIKAIKEKLGI